MQNLSLASRLPEPKTEMLSENQIEFDIRVAEKCDVEHLSVLHFSIFSDGWSTEDFLSFINNDFDFVLVAKELNNSIIIGFVVVRMVLDEAEILTIGVSSEHQNTGVGTQLYQTLEQILNQRKIVTLFLELRRSNAAAAGLYKKSGFKLVATRKDYYRSLSGTQREDALIMKKDL